jgi:hypothetical protein
MKIKPEHRALYRLLGRIQAQHWITAHKLAELKMVDREAMEGYAPGFDQLVRTMSEVWRKIEALEANPANVLPDPIGPHKVFYWPGMRR